MSVRSHLLLAALAVLAAAAAVIALDRPGVSAGDTEVTSAALDPPASQRIWNIKLFLEQCPQSDSAYATIRADFQIRRNGVLLGDVPCSPQISQLPVAQYNDELIVLQGLRTAYHMDFGQSGYLPWTSGTLYAWLRTKVGGFDVRTDTPVSYCCTVLGGKPTVVIAAQDDFNRDFDRTWKGISDNIALYAHEARHMDGFPHSSGCGIPNGCDPTFDAANLSSFGLQYWLSRSFLNGAINVGFACAPPAEVVDIAQWHLSAANGYRTRFDQAKPATVLMPSQPGGDCLARAVLPMLAAGP